ncbi:MAG TPA: hypothetical protein VNA20_01225 [Frankiaceae bacterium]|nr:hypothetical protein [Frankiaceae bacterium]
MRTARLLIATTAAAAAFATPASAAWSDHVVTVEFQGPVVCVTEPCDQPMPVVVCVVPAAVCTPR